MIVRRVIVFCMLGSQGSRMTAKGEVWAIDLPRKRNSCDMLVKSEEPEIEEEVTKCILTIEKWSQQRRKLYHLQEKSALKSRTFLGTANVIF